MSSLRRADWEVRTCELSDCQHLVAAFHYARRGSNTATFRHGLYHRESGELYGVAWWIPPTKGAAIATWGGDWRKVISLSRLVCVPSAPTNAATFLLGASARLIKEDGRFPCLVTYADEWQGHNGTIYLAANWEYMGKTKKEGVWVDRAGSLVARKAGPHTRTKAEMEALGHIMLGRFAKRKYRKILSRGLTREFG